MSVAEPQVGQELKKEPTSFEQAMSELEEIVNKLETDNTPIDEAVEFYVRGKELYDYCAKILRDSKLKIENIGEK